MPRPLAPATRLAAPLVAALATGLLLTACSGDPAPPANPNPPLPAITTPTTPSSQAAPKPLAKECAEVLPAAEVAAALGKDPTALGVRGIVGVPEPKIGRTARLGCYYSPPQDVPPRDAPPERQQAPAQLELGVATYADEAAARKRVRATAEGERAQGAAANDVQVGDGRAVFLVGAKNRMLVHAAGRATVVLTLAHGVVADDRAGPVLTELAAKVAAAVPR
ncbi:hypothetical protein JOF53_006799 [Crossiella equi]|uniref:DUF3558 domain-containing protein n=1 Tax=Crossiella equi TaxID=130796 RepID=A0ABS5ANG1_9PSEU|nr:hypothetical protein [Crossiella equi]MBP2477927.1 hypothetical protein [Crossiella equi]